MSAAVRGSLRTRWGFGVGLVGLWNAATFPGNMDSENALSGCSMRLDEASKLIHHHYRHSGVLVLVHKTDIDADPRANLTHWSTITSMVLTTSACGNSTPAQLKVVLPSQQGPAGISPILSMTS